MIPASVYVDKQAMAEQDESLFMFQIYLSKGDCAFVKIEDGMLLLVSETALIEEAGANWMPQCMQKAGINSRPFLLRISRLSRASRAAET